MSVRISAFDNSATAVLKNWSQAIEDRLKMLEKNGSISKSGNFVLNRLLTPTDINTGAGYWWLSPTHMSYRPLSNPLHGTIVGGNPAIVIDGFTLRIGHQDVVNNGGTISTGLAWDTLYFVYYDDVDLSGGVQTYFCDRFKEVALVGDGRLFVGSVRTPLSATAVDTIGNNDGGVGAQVGGHVARYAPTITQSYLSSTNDPPIITEKNLGVDNDWLTCTNIQITSTNSGEFYSGNSSQATIVVGGFGSVYDDSDRWFTHLRLRVKAGGTVYGQGYGSTPGAWVNIEYSLDSVHWTAIRTSSGLDAAALGVLTDTVTLPDGTHPSAVSVRINAMGSSDARWKSGGDTSVDVSLYEAILEGDF